LDLRQGGAILIHMRAPDGVVHPMAGVFQEIVEPERLVFTSVALDNNGNALFEILNTVVFEEEDGKTTLTVRANITMATAGGARHLAGMEQGWRLTLDRLEKWLAAERMRQVSA
ncbi:MAG: SRPBCC domain-containing protein, partial [Bryobacterales bacterium]|nr:SRPBCC domain-containing protein [Bryobacterales bacterium]